MTAIHTDPLQLTNATQLPLPSHARTFSRSKSPIRSPARKAHFAARELDPLLKDLSPDSTLEALQETDAIRGNHAEQNALAKSISDATESERELGIRAAIAAKKLREWTDEVNNWPWPSSTDRAWGAGFIPADSERPSFGSLSREQIQQYEERLDEIWDAIETLHITELKDFVFSSHQPSSRSISGHSTAYSRLRDFTALITATVIQLLPVLATLHLLLETWSIRLTISKQIPDLLNAIQQVLEGLATINDIVQDDVKSHKVTRQELETAKALFAQKVANLGKRVDNMLDLLEGQEDSLPQAWIDSLESIEHKYADWVIQAERVVVRNELPSPNPAQPVSADQVALPLLNPPSVSKSSPQISGSAVVDKEKAKKEEMPPKRKPLLEVNFEPDTSHKRGVSEISMADSTLSNYSFENAEIIDARAAPLLPSPRISVVGNPLSTAATSSWMSSKGSAADSPSRPPVLARASTASIEPVFKVNVREIVLRKSASHDLLGSRKSSASTLQAGRGQPQLVESSVASPEHEVSDPIHGLVPRNVLTPLAVSPSPSLRVDPLSLKGRELIEPPVQRPIVPRRSSKRLSMPLLNSNHRPDTPPQQSNVPDRTQVKAIQPVTPPDKIQSTDTFDDRLKTILASMPAKIRLTEGSDSSLSASGSASSSRASSPSHAMRLSPVRNAKHTRPANPDIRVYHLKGIKSRDTPVKLYIRPVGEHGERIMVRVGGGWADLAEYLREYSLHHGGRGLKESKLEVAEYPSSAQSKSPVGVKKSHGHKIDAGFDFGLNDPPQSQASSGDISSPWRPPPVPLVPPNMVVQAKTTGNDRQQIRTPVTSLRPQKRYSTVVTTTPLSTTTTSNRYTPLGGAGPVQSRHVISGSAASTPNEALVEGVVDRARAVSGGHARSQAPVSATIMTNGNTTTVVSPVTTITTSMSTSKQRSQGTLSRRLSSWTSSSITAPKSEETNRPSVTDTQRSSQSSGISSVSNDTADKGLRNSRRKSMMGLGDVGGIRRVFLRKKSDK